MVRLKQDLKQVASLAIALAGAIHLALAPVHFAHAPAHGIFFAVAGAAEITWAILFLRQPNEATYQAGIMLAGGLVVLWTVTRVLPAPFEHEVGVIDLGGIVCKISELVGLGALLTIALQGGIAGRVRQSLPRLISEAIIVSFFVAFLTYVAGHEFEPLMPFLAGEKHQEELQGLE